MPPSFAATCTWTRSGGGRRSRWEVARYPPVASSAKHAVAARVLPNSTQAPCCGPGLLAVASSLLLWPTLLCGRCQALAQVTCRCVCLLRLVQVCVELSGYVHELNTNYGLYSALARALRQHDTAAAASTGAERHASAAGVLAASFTSAAAAAGAAAGERAAEVSEAAAAGGWDAEALLVGRMLKRDFERFGVHLDGEKRDRMTLLTHRSQALGMQFTQNVLEPSQLGQLELRGGLAGGPLCVLSGMLRRPEGRTWQYQGMHSHSFALGWLMIGSY